MLGDARMEGGLFTRVPDGLVRDGLVRTAVACATGEKVGARLFPAPIPA
jgi:hypothetical protein